MLFAPLKLSYGVIHINSLMICMNESFILLLFKSCKYNIMSNQDNQNKTSWEEVQGLSWIFYED